MTPMKHSGTSQPAVSDFPGTGAGESVADEKVVHIEHMELPGFGSGPIFPFSWLIGLFKRVTSSH
jgi:hypothetical protein